MTVKGHLIEYNQNTDIAVMQIDIELLQKDNVCTGVYAVYRKNEQMLELSGNAQIKQGSDTFRAQHITMNLDSQEIILDGRVKGSVVDERKSENASEENETDGENAESTDTTENTEGSTDETGETGENVESGENSAESANGGKTETESAKESESEHKSANADKKDETKTEKPSKKAKSKKASKKNNSAHTADDAKETLDENTDNEKTS